MDRHELELLTRDELLGLARSAGIDGVEWLSREELVATLARGSSTGRTRGIFDRARALIDKARELGRTFRSSRPPEPPSPPPPPPPGPPSTAGSFETLTMAEVLAAQGHVEEARRIVEVILARDPDNAGARALLARLPTPAKRTSTGPAPAAGYDEDTIGIVLLGPTTLFAYWEVTEEGVGRARGLLREEGRLVLRISTATAAGATTHDQPAAAIGDRVVEDAPADARHRAAVGLLAESGRFVPIVHSSAVTTPPAGPSADSRLEWVEVALAPASAEVQRPAPGAAKTAEPRAIAEARRQAEADAGERRPGVPDRAKLGGVGQ